MTKYRSAWVSLSGKVFVSQDELAEALGLREADEQTAIEQLSDVPPESLRIAFKDLANDKIRNLISTDEPMKLDEVEIDMDSFR